MALVPVIRGRPADYKGRGETRRKASMLSAIVPRTCAEGNLPLVVVGSSVSGLLRLLF